MTARIVAFGSRTVTDKNYPSARQQIHEGLAIVKAQPFFADAELHHGECEGADLMFAEEWAALGGVVVAHPARWSMCVRTCKPGHRKRRRDGSTYCPSAGFRRNKDMRDLAPDLGVMAHVNNSRGTAMMAGLLEEVGVHIQPFDIAEPYRQED